LKAKHFKLIYSTLIGNTMEFYDFIVFAFMSNYLSKLFFTSSNSSVGLLYTFGVFASGYMTRPLGSLFFGYIGDKYGRKISLFYSVLLVTI
jgi:MHS family proline/betaine transporter-like MFS transporter